MRLSISTPWVTHAPRVFVETLTGAQEGTVLISITDPKSPPARVKATFDDVLALKFWDITESRMYGNEWLIAIQESQGAAIGKFLREKRGANVLVHCEAGISRSGAVAESVLQAFPEYKDAGFALSGSPMRRPNYLVKRLVLRALGCNDSDPFVSRNLEVEHRFLKRSKVEWNDGR